MKHYFLLLILISGVFLFSCQNATDNNVETNDSTNVVNDEPVEVIKKTCSLSKFSFDYGGNKNEIKFIYNEEGKIVSSEMKWGESEEVRSAAYVYNEDGSLAEVGTDGSKIKYIYDEKGKLVTLEGEGSLSTRTLEYNDAGQIIKQNIMLGGKVFSSFIYEYDENGAPVKASLYDNKGEEAEVYEISYDDKINPFAGMAAFGNVSEMLMGYPVGNYIHNVNGITKTYVKKTAYMINDEYKNAGDKDVDKITFEYNESDYPISILKEQNGKQASTLLEYDCK